MNKESGFTLIEVIVSLIIVGIMAAIAGMGIVTSTKGYIQTKENVHTSQKAHLAMTRIKRELMELTGIAAKDDTQPWVIFDNPTGRLAIAKVADTIEMYFNLNPTQTTLPANGDLLVDNVQSFSINYFKGSNAWQLTDDIDLLSALQATLELTRNDGSGQTISFSTTINPRNTNNFGGAPPTSAPFTAPQYECFVATAAYGQPNHPMVLLLRQFRDTYLLTWKGGRIMTNVYYAIGPKFAAVIKDRAWARKTVRFILLPVVGWVYLLLHHPASIPFILVISWLSSHMILRWFYQHHRKLSPVVSNNRGNVLVGLVVTMLIFAVLAAGMVSLTSTSTSNQVTSNSTARAYYLAESGFRYAASRYLNTGDLDFDGETIDNRNQELETLHDVEFSLSDPDEKFRLRFYPYYFTTTVNHAPGNSSIQTKFSGTQPADLTVPATGKLKIGSDIYSYGSYNAGTGIFGSLSPVLQEFINDHMSVTPVANPSGSETVTQNDTLTLSNASAFPTLNGKIQINGIKYAYVSRNGNILENITDADDPSRTFSISVDSSTDVVLEPFVKVISLGTVGQHELKATRQITYNVPLPSDPTKGVRVEFYDPFDDTAFWNTSTLGSYGIANIDSENVLKVTGTGSGMGSTKASLISINWALTNKINFPAAHLRAGNYLSYDTQTKIGFDSVPVPANGFDPLGVPTYYAAGISFRLDIGDNFYGISFMRGNNTASDDIDDALLPKNDVNLVVLWQQTGDGTSRKWLAYSEVGLFFSDDVEGGVGGWTVNSPADGRQWERATNFAHSGSYSWTTSPTGTYVDGENMTLTSESIDLSTAATAILSFWTRYRIYSDDDFGIVQISVDGGAPITLNPGAQRFTSNQDTFVQKSYDISSDAAGHSDVKIIFLFDRNNNPALTRDGWWVDDIKIVRDFDINKSTLLLRLIEGATLGFNSGGTTPIEIDDTVSQSNGARGRVILPPILTSGNWTAGDAAGFLIINNVSSTAFQIGNPLDVPGKGNNLATTQSFKARDNYIQTYYGNKDGNGIPNGNPYDQERQPNTIGIANWPPDPGDLLTAETDYYTLVQWNFDVDASVTRFKDEDGRFTIITTDTLTSPSGIFPYDRPELGLHAMGDGATNVFFEDFAIQLDVLSGSGFLTPIQQ